MPNKWLHAKRQAAPTLMMSSREEMHKTRAEDLHNWTTLPVIVHRSNEDA
jgi:hypothetical protein